MVELKQVHVLKLRRGDILAVTIPDNTPDNMARIVHDNTLELLKRAGREYVPLMIKRNGITLSVVRPDPE